MTNPDGSSGEQMAERVSMPVPCQGSEGGGLLVYSGNYASLNEHRNLLVL